MTRRTATVAIPTFNGEDYLERLLTSVEEQEFDGDVEILVIDSGSTDGTLDIIRRHPRVRLHEIPNSEFGHGRTRDLAVRMATGSHIAFLTQDAIPMDRVWLTELLAPFDLDDRIAIVTGRQNPRDRAFPLQRYDITSTFAVQGHQAATSIYGGSKLPLSDKQKGVAGFHSDVNAAVRKDLATGEIPFRDVPYSEDHMMAEDVLSAGYWRAYAGRAVVEHSNDLTLHEYGLRMVDETIGLRRLGLDFGRMTVGDVLKATFKGTVGDSIRLAGDSSLSLPTKARWFFVNPFYQFRRWSSLRRAIRMDLDDHASVQAQSLEHRRKSRRHPGS